MTECRGCGYVPEDDDYPLMDDDLCEECHFEDLSLVEAMEPSRW